MITKSSAYVCKGTSTDITIRWKFLYGWIPPSEMPEIQKKWAEIEADIKKDIELLKAFNKIIVKETK